ncbi:MAG: amidase, partial [Pseudomonadota bacterium]|nr:amidase [Pseudomonadota bacterium]
MPDLRNALSGYSDWLGYGHGERADAWLERLTLNRAELDAFRSASSPACAAYCAAAATLASADGNLAGSRAGNMQPLPADAAAALARASRNADLHAFTWLADAVPAHGAGFLAGVPVAIKDLMAVAGMPLSAGSAAFERRPAPADAEIVARLKRAGAVVIGMTNLHEFAYGITSDNPHFGRVVNPAAPQRIPGGSSGGSAAAIAAGIVRAAVGTDTAGSIRIPAACCGITGFKPSYDALPRRGVLDLAPSLDHVGPMGRSVEDCAALFAAMLDLPAVPAWRYDDLSAIGVARLRGFFDGPLDGDVRAAVDAAVLALTQDGARCTEQQVEGIELAGAIQLNTICAEATAVHAERLREHGARMGEDVRVRLEIGQFLPGPWYVKAQRLRARLVARIDALFAGADVLLCPTLRTPAPPVGASQVDIGGTSYPLHTAVTSLTLPFNLAGLPAISIPWTRSKDGVPVCLQVVGARGAD